MRVLSPFDFEQNQLLQPVVHPTNPAPSSPVAGQLYYDTSDNKLYYFNGSIWVDAASGSVSDATTISKGIIQLAGDLAGTAASPQIAAGAIVNADVNVGAAIARSKLDFGAGLVDSDIAAANKDGASGTPSLRTLGSGAAQAMPGNRTLDAITAPAADVSLNTHKITNLVDPSSAQDAATKNYVDGVAQGLDVKPSARVGYTTQQALTGAAAAEGGITPSNGNTVLLMGQTAPEENGLWTVNTGGAWTRHPSADTWAELISAFFFVEQGTNADNGFVCTVDTGGTLGVTAVTFTQFSGAGQITAGNGLAKTGNTLDVNVDGSSLEINADILRVKALGITNAMLAGLIDLTAKVTGTLPLGNGGLAVDASAAAGKATARSNLAAAGYYSSATHGSGTTITIAQSTHGLRASRGLIVQCRIESTGEDILVDNTVAANGDVTVTFAVSQSANTIRTTIIG